MSVPLTSSTRPALANSSDQKLTREQVPTKILELTTQKFDLARIPLDFQQDEGKDWADGTPKKVVEDLIDYW